MRVQSHIRGIADCGTAGHAYARLDRRRSEAMSEGRRGNKRV